jgi:hypothetical protein
MTEKWRTEICGLLSSEEILIVAIRSGENFSAKHFSVIAFLKKLVTLGNRRAARQTRHAREENPPVICSTAWPGPRKTRQSRRQYRHRAHEGFRRNSPDHGGNLHQYFIGAQCPQWLINNRQIVWISELRGFHFVITFNKFLWTYTRFGLICNVIASVSQRSNPFKIKRLLRQKAPRND